jgi:hypothetical protein
MASFPQQQQYWEGSTFQLLGQGIRYHKVAFLSVKVYAVALYVELEPATAQLKQMEQQGILRDHGTDAVCAALLAGHFRKVLHINMLRSVTADQFKEGLRENLEPRLEKMGGLEKLAGFMDFFSDKKINNSTQVPLLWTVDKQALTSSVFRPGTTDFHSAPPELVVNSDPFSSALFEMYMGTDSIVPDGRGQWTKGALAMIQAQAANASCCWCS